MDKIKRAPMFKKFVVEWQQGGLACNWVKEKLVVKPNSLTFTRKGAGLYEDEPYWDDCDFRYKISSFDALEWFETLCDCFLKSRNPEIKSVGFDMDIFSIECVLEDETKIKEEYMGTFESNGLEDLIRVLKKFMPETCPLPYFFYGIPNYEEEEDDLPFFNVDKETLFFIDVDRKHTIVRKRKNILELEYISKENPNWKKTNKDDAYEREYYLGQGNTCLFDITFDEVLNKFREWGIPLKLLDED